VYILLPFGSKTGGLCWPTILSRIYLSLVCQKCFDAPISALAITTEDLEGGIKVE